MNRFNPLIASNSIKDSFVDYISTSFDIADNDYRNKLKQELQKEGFIAKGPFLDVSGSYKTGLPLEELIGRGEASPMFKELEPVEEEEKELPLLRPLYLHQQLALEKANQGKNLVVTTGTGSGKTECFIIPIIDALLKEIENSTLDNGVRAIIVYPMNALANDQIKRMRDILKGFPQITFGLYNGNTEWTQEKAIKEYKKAYEDKKDPLPNEMISRERMRETPPHILITNYSMLEYMLLRPKDDSVFSRSKLKYIILDEAHVYKGTTGIETAMLMRRLRARISNRESAQFILTSATLGEKAKNKEIVAFAEKLCDARFESDSIIRSVDATPPMKSSQLFPVEMFSELQTDISLIDSVLEKYNIKIDGIDGDPKEKLYHLLLNSSLFEQFMSLTMKPISFDDLFVELNKKQTISKEQLISFIELCSIADNEGLELSKIKYHYFVRTLEGLYITIDASKKLFLNRKEICDEDEEKKVVFEAAVCSDCGRIALVGKEDGIGRFVQVARKSDSDPKLCDYYLLDKDELGDDLFDEEDEPSLDDKSFVICSSCGSIASKADTRFGPICDCENNNLVSVKRARRTESGKAKCPACGFGSLRSFYLGYDATTAVLGTELFEQLPEEVEIRTDVSTSSQTESSSGMAGLFSINRAVRPKIEKRHRRFLCFSDSRSDAAYFATYMEKSYEEFLRRRAIVLVSSQIPQTRLSVGAFVDQLTRCFDNHETFNKWTPDGNYDKDRLHLTSENNAWVAILNEMYNARRGTSLPSLGLMSFAYNPLSLSKREALNDLANNISVRYPISEKEAHTLIDLLVMDAVFLGAINNGNPLGLDDAEREYIFYSPKEKRIALRKTANSGKNISGWAGRKKPNGKYYPNTRIARLVNALGVSEAEADEFLEQFWNYIFSPEGEEFVLNANDFSVVLPGDEDLSFYKCEKCGRITSYNIKDSCVSIKCGGVLRRIDTVGDNHYINLYRSPQMKPLQIKEHTAQLSKNQQSRYQKAFVDGDINALSCSTTFEMGVDVGGLETVYMRNVPPSPANYVQRAGRAGRANQTAAFVLTFAKLSSHDLTFYKDPSKMISGQIQVPVFEIENEKVVNRHIYAVALSKFFAAHEDIYDQDNQNVFLNEKGYEVLKDYLNSKPEDLRSILKKSIPAQLQEPYGIEDYSWTEKLIGEDGTLEIAVKEFREEVSQIENALKTARKNKNDSEANNLSLALRRFRCGKDDKQPKKSLIEFLARNNVLPKYGFPVDTVELSVNSSVSIEKGEALQLSRDLQMAIAEYAPGSEVIADGQKYVSRYIRKLPGKSQTSAWEEGFYSVCPNCKEPNFSPNSLTKRDGQACLSCGKKIMGSSWKTTLEPRRGFWTEGKPTPAPLRKPERDYKTDDYYVGDIQRKEIDKLRFEVDGKLIELESTANDSLAVVGKTRYRVCKVCGYATDEKIPDPHYNARGYLCSNRRNFKDYLLSHTFKTYVAKVTFYTVEAKDYNTMLSVMFALLEGLSQSLGIERNDIKGCLHLVQYKERGTNIFSLILYDAVAGGAGHVRRLVTSDAKVFQQVLQKAIEIVDTCECDSSCYQCLRNYYNSKVHDELDRKLASAFLHQWVGEYQLVKDNSSTGSKAPVVVEPGECKVADYSSWAEFSEAYGIDESSSWDSYGVPNDCVTFTEMRVDGILYNPFYVWNDKKVAVFEMSSEFENLEKHYGWTLFSLDVEPSLLSKILLGG